MEAAIAKIAEILTEEIGKGDTFEARDEARTLLAKTYDVWVRQAEGRA